MRGKSAIVLVLAVAVLAAGAAQAADWNKVGSGTLVFKHPQIDIKAKKSAQPCTQIRIKAAGEMVNVSTIKIFFADGSSQDVAFKDVLRPGVYSDPIDIDGGPKALEMIQLNHTVKGNRGSLRAQLTVQGTS